MVPLPKTSVILNTKTDEFLIWRKAVKYKSGTRRRAIEYEKEIAQRWKDNKTFEKSVENRPESNGYVFYDGPPFITGVPHHGTLLSSIIKDAVPRFWTMQGKRVERVWGWDSHGLPAENFVEKQLGIQDRREIGTKISLEEYITTARDSMVVNSATWEGVIDRIGRWVDFKGAYKTMDKEYMESVWWAFKTLYEKGKIYEGYKVLMFDTKFATPVSKNEVTMDNDAYQLVTDPSVYVRFKLTDNAGLIEDNNELTLLAWTTTPWTLPANTAVAVNPEISYSVVSHNDEYFVVAEDLVEKVFTDEKHKPLDYDVIKTIKGTELAGLNYQPLFVDDVYRTSRTLQVHDKNVVENTILSADYVTTESGTGIVHLAPCYGEEDFELAKTEGLRVLEAIDENGYYYPEVPQFAGMEVWSSNKQIAKDLKESGIVWKIEYIQHEYPFNPRSKQKIMYRAVPSWFYDVEGQKQEMFAHNSDSVNWFPKHIKHGRFEKNIEQAPDWNLSRDRFWATAMPVWKGVDADGKEHVKVVGSYAELKELSGVELEDYHRPWIDDVRFTIENIEYQRVDKVLDGWFESGSMPFAQFHYPFENKEKFEANFPGDFIAEYVAQVRAWFYYMHTVNVGLFGSNAFKNVIVTGTLAGNDGRKMSKSLGNFTDPNELMDKYSADSLRFLLLSSPVMNGEDFSLNDKDVGDVARKLSMVWNVYDFFTLYAEVDGWEWNGEVSDPSEESDNVLDRWVVSKLHRLITEVESCMKDYDLQSTLKPVLPFIDDLSNWYVRRSRKRFWKSEDDQDKDSAYKTLHYVLVQLSHVLAPFTPFLAEELYIKLTGGESVHLNDWPEFGHIDELLVSQMDTARKAVNEGLSQRSRAQIKTRQPLSSVGIESSVDLGANTELLCDIIKEELNVKDVSWSRGNEELAVALDTEITPELELEGLAREVVRAVQSSRKAADYDVDDRIQLELFTDDEKLTKAIGHHADYISAETLSTDIQVNSLEGTELSETVKVSKIELGINHNRE